MVSDWSIMYYFLQIHNLAANSVRVGKDKTVNSEMQSVSLYIAELLLDRGAELNMSDYRGRLPLYFAVEDVSINKFAP